jgi:hypothetical protein
VLSLAHEGGCIAPLGGQHVVVQVAVAQVSEDAQPHARYGALGRRTITLSAHSGHSIRPRPFCSRKSSSLPNQPSKRWPLWQRKSMTFMIGSAGR